MNVVSTINIMNAVSIDAVDVADTAAIDAAIAVRDVDRIDYREIKKKLIEYFKGIVLSNTFFEFMRNISF
ncbi:hypothetical protein [Clostridium sp. Marseille-Q7071]